MALKAADKLIAMHRDYTTMPYPDFHAKHGSVDATVLFARVRAEYVEARATSPSQSPIPAGVRYSAENDNFYDAWSGIGCGQAFYDDWYGRRTEFPRQPRP